ncbi:MAG: Tox-REase-5 domain-containing protein, partial [Bacteroidota bacterium]
QIDPLASDYVHNSTYAFAENRVVDGIDLEGLEYVRSPIVRGFSQNGLKLQSTDHGMVSQHAILPPKQTPLRQMTIGPNNSHHPSMSRETMMIAEGIGIGETFTMPWMSKAVITGLVKGFNTLKNSDNLASMGGQWVKTSETMSDAAADFQKSITGMDANQSYLLNEVKFDGVTDGGMLLDAKSGMKNFVGKDGNFQNWFKGSDGLVDQANRQLRAADGNPIQWHFQDKGVMKATQNLFKKNDIEGIELIYTPTE